MHGPPRRVTGVGVRLSRGSIGGPEQSVRECRNRPDQVVRPAVEGMTGIEPAPSVWKTEALPLSYIPVLRV